MGIGAPVVIVVMAMIMPVAVISGPALWAVRVCSHPRQVIQFDNLRPGGERPQGLFQKPFKAVADADYDIRIRQHARLGRAKGIAVGGLAAAEQQLRKARPLHHHGREGLNGRNGRDHLRRGECRRCRNGKT